jgi:FixJ family two-component response regulator
MRPYLEKPFTKKRLVEWLKVKALSSSLSTTQKKKSMKQKVGSLKRLTRLTSP